MGRIGRLFNIWKTNWDGNPAARGAAKMTAGVALILEGIFGMRARLRGNSGGLIAAMFLIPFGLLFFSIGYFIQEKPFKDEVTIHGTIINTESHMSRDSDGHNQRMYKAVYGYQVDGKDYHFLSSVSSSPAPRVGKSVKIGYSASNPNKARRVDGMDGNSHKIFQGVGLFVTLLGFYQLMICLLLIGGGLALFLSGRKDRTISGTTDGFFKDLFSLVREEKTNRSVLIGGSGEAMLQNAFANLTRSSSAPAASSMPPAGWMVDPENSSQMRWWDGAAWSDMRKPVEPASPESSNTPQGW